MGHRHATPHDHGHRDRPQLPPSGGRAEARRRLTLTLALTGTIFLAEAIGGFYSGSLALLSDAGHMLSDLGALLVSLFAIAIATRPANSRKTYGYYRTEILGAMGNAVALVLITGFIVYEAIGRLLHPSPVKVGPMLVVATVGLLANAGSLLLLRSEQRNLNVRAVSMHILGDLVSSIGVIASGIAMKLTDAYVLDPLLSLAIAVLIVVGAFQVLRESVDILLEATPAHIDSSAVADALRAVEGVSEVHDLHIWSITSGMCALSGHVIVDPARLPEAHRILDDLKAVMLERFAIDHTTIQIEPEGYEHVGEVHVHG